VTLFVSGEGRGAVAHTVAFPCYRPAGMRDNRPAAATSGDLRADRRFLHAEASAAEGDFAAAAELLEQCLEIAPDWAPAWFALSVARERLGDLAAAITAYRRAFACDPEDVLGASLALARLGAAPVPDVAAPAYVARLFDQYAPHFDAHLIDGLGYRAPALLRDAVAEVCVRTHRPMHFGRALDLGCGTGLAGAAFRDCVEHLEGVDLSAGMIAQARTKGVYDALYVEDLVDHLRATADRDFDLILAADVLVYMGDLMPLFAQASRVLGSKGLVAFAAESHEGQGYLVGSKMRFAHSRSYLEQVADASGLTITLLRSDSTRNDTGERVGGLIGVLGR
jgi:predicted TPR repeat methyltransferase